MSRSSAHPNPTTKARMTDNPSRLPRTLALLMFWLLLLSGLSQARELLVLTAAPVQAGKFKVLDEHAAPLGWRVRHLYAERLTGEEGPALFQGADFVLLDIPYDPVVESVERKVGRWLDASSVPWLKSQAQAHAARGLDAAHAAALWRYYANGGKRNLAHFFRYLDALLGGGDTAAVPAPLEYPEQGIYHPRHDAIFADADTYFAWRGVAPNEGPPVIALAIHRSYLAAELTHFIDHFVDRVEAHGAVPLVFYTPMADADAYTRLLAPRGKPLVDVIVTSQIMLEADKRRAEFNRLGVPVIQAMPFRRGDIAEWRADPAGVHLMDVPFYLAQPEYAGVVDAMTAAAVEKGSGQVVAIPEQVEAVVVKALRLASLQRTPNHARRVAVFYWNYPPGETNLGASYLNIPRSFAGTLAAMRQRGYEVDAPTAEALLPSLQALLKPYYRTGDYDRLLRADLAERLPLATYRAWFDRLPAATRARIVARWGEPEASGMACGKGADAYFPIPRLKLGNVVFIPQPPRSDGDKDKERALYHDTKVPVNHYYLAVYLWAREQFGAHALVHFGTHGTQEWMPGKERGLSVHDDALLPLGDLPVIYPYIVDDVGEAVQAKRRGRALIVSHQTPPFAPAGLHNELAELHHLVHEWQNLTEGAVRDKTAEAILKAAAKLNFDKDVGVSDARVRADFPTYLNRLHDWLHELALAHQPQGMHTFGRSAEDRHRLGMVMQILGRDYADAAFRFSRTHAAFLDCAADRPDCQPARLEADEADEVFVTDYRDIHNAIPYRLLERVLLGGAPLPADAEPQLATLLEQARAYYAALDASPEMTALLDALEGRHIATGYGGDPIRNPDALPTGRNLYGFDPSKVPTKAAWEAGQEALEKLIAAYREKHGRMPEKLAFTLWSVETMRHFGVLEAQAFYALGVQPKWDAGGRVNGLELIPREALGRPRIDVVLSATGLYRDHFPNVMRWLAEAVVLAGKAEEADNAVRRSSATLRQRLRASGMGDAEAAKWADVRIFSNESGVYGAGIEDAVLASDTWNDEAKLANLYLSRLQYAYGADMKDWGAKLPNLNLYAENLKGVQAAALARSSNLYGMLTTDDPFQYLGGIALAVRHLTGKSPELYIANLREADRPKAETAAQFLARELRTRQFHPGWIRGMQQEGYSGTLEMLDSINNFWGWQVTAPDIVRADQWQEFADVYVRDKYRLGMRAYFEHANPAALAQMIERMLEAVRKGYWQADAATVRELANRYRDLAIRRDVRSDNAAFQEFVARHATPAIPAAGYGLGRPAAAQPASPPPEAAPAVTPEMPEISGMRLDKVVATPAPPAYLLGLLLLVLTAGAGAWRQGRARPSSLPQTAMAPRRPEP
jgi:cobaltochelatase CobN